MRQRVYIVIEKYCDRGIRFQETGSHPMVGDRRAIVGRRIITVLIVHASVQGRAMADAESPNTRIVPVSSSNAAMPTRSSKMDGP
ncbi:MAG: hypothetical protein ACI91T_002160 [Natronomonas sp.]|jgi:hypothetical protein